MRTALSTLARGKSRLLLGCLAILAIAIHLVATSRFGLGMTPDSAVYISVARSLQKGAGLIDYTGSPLVIFPPVYPVLLALVGAILHRDPASVARGVNACLFGAVVFLSGVLFQRYLRLPRGYAALATLSALVSIPIVPVVFLALSDALFICLTLAYLLYLDDYLRTASLPSLLALSFIVSLACLTRYMGAVLIVAGVLSILIFSRDSIAIRFRNSAVFGLISALPLGAWALRNFALSGTLFGARMASAYTYYDNLRACWNTVVAWYLSAAVLYSPAALVLISLSIVVLAVLTLRRKPRDLAEMVLPYGPLLVFSLLYLAFLLASSESGFTQIIDNRYLSPIYMPTTIMFLALARGLLTPILDRLPSMAAHAVLFACVALWMIYPLNASVSVVARQRSRGVWYTGRSWRDSQTMRYVRDHPSLAARCTVYSNGYDAIYILTGMVVKSLPVKSGASAAPDIAALVGEWPPEGRACVVEFDEIDRRTYLLTPADLLTLAHLESRTTFDDGTIYVLSRK